MCTMQPHLREGAAEMVTMVAMVAMVAMVVAAAAVIDVYFYLEINWLHQSGV